jgi:subtilisin family serine protease
MKFWSKALILGGLMTSVSALAGTGFNLDKEHVPGELIVKFRNAKSMAAVKAVREFGGIVKYQFESVGAQVIRFPSLKSNDALFTAAKNLAANPEVEYVEANTILHINKTPNDAEFTKQYGMHNTGATGGTADADIDAVEAWEVSTGSKDVLVGVIDTGVDHSHPDIAPNYWRNPGETGVDASGKDKSTNGVDDDGNGFVDDFRGWDFANNDNDPMDDHAHGTHCAGVIGARGNDGVGVAGVNWNVSIVGIKFLTGSGSGTLENAVKSIEYGNKIGVSLTSNSWGGGGFSQTMLDAIKAANSKGILFVAAAGNDASNNDQTPSYPASYDVQNVISVAASDHKDQMASFSNSGVRTVHVAAPGVDIWSSVPGSKYQKMSGTSMATPHVAGLAALVKAAIPDATASQVRQRILGGVDRSAYWAARVSSGGRINALNSIEVDNVPPAAVTDLNIVESGVMSVTAEWSPVGDDGATGNASAYEVRQSAREILNDADWNAATIVPVTTNVVEGKIRASINFSDFNQTGYLAVRANDNVGNQSRGARSVQFSTRQVNRFYDRSATSLDGFTAQAPWALETLSDGTAVFSDSPGSQYAANANVALTSQSISLPSSDLTLALELKHDLESGYDFLHVEMSTDGGASWVLIEKLSGKTENFVRKIYNLKDRVGAATSVQLRFRVTSDNSVFKDGALIRNIALIAPL